MNDSKWNSRKLLVAILVTLVGGAAGIAGSLEGMYLCIALVGPASLYIGGEALIDAVTRFATAKFKDK